MNHSADIGGIEILLYMITEQYKYSELTAKVIGCARPFIQLWETVYGK